MKVAPRPQHHLASASLSRARGRRAGAAGQRGPLVVRNPPLPPLPAEAAPPAPKTIYLTYKEADAIPPAIVKQLTDLNPGWRVELFGDMECLTYLEGHWFPEHLAHFRSIPAGPIRADFWRACIMYTHGGCYLDVDTVLQEPIESFVLPEVDVCTSGSATAAWRGRPDYRRLNPAIIIARPRTRIMARTVGRLLACSRVPYDYWGWSITYGMMAAVCQEAGRLLPTNTEGVYVTKQGEKLQLLSESQEGDDIRARHTSWKGRRVMLNHNVAIYDNQAHAFRSENVRDRKAGLPARGEPPASG